MVFLAHIYGQRAAIPTGMEGFNAQRVSIPGCPGHRHLRLPLGASPMRLPRVAPRRHASQSCSFPENAKLACVRCVIFSVPSVDIYIYR